MTTTLDIGDTKEIGIAFTDADNVAADPATVTFKIREPDGIETSYLYGTDAELVKDSVGNYHVAWNFTKRGRHIIKLSGAGVVDASEQTDVYVRAGI